MSPESILLLSTMNSLAAQFGTLRDDFYAVKNSVQTLGARLDLQGKDIISLKNHVDNNKKNIDNLSKKINKLPTAGKISELTLQELDDITSR